ncbi:hypothetical protein SFRURICE_009375 [Spodoptera frugiperda]|nr:hypothetical protein SFRURICE_009375 [Spodoptera frugiperda]
MSPSPLSPASNQQNPARAPPGRVRMRTEHSTPRTRAEKHLFSHSTQHTHTAHISALVESRELKNISSRTAHSTPHTSLLWWSPGLTMTSLLGT